MVSTKATGISTFFMLLLPTIFISIIFVTVLSGIYAQGNNANIENYEYVGQLGIGLGLAVNLCISYLVYLYFESKEPKKEEKGEC